MLLNDKNLAQRALISTTILIIDDSPILRSQVAGRINANLPETRCLDANDCIRGLKIALDTLPDLILCDIEMPAMDGMKVLAMTRSRQELRHTPLILLTGVNCSEMKIRFLEAGASDYITKPFTEAELLARINIHLRIKCLQDELLHKNRLLQKLSDTDPLTGLYNRRFLLHALEQEKARCIRQGRTCPW